MDPVLSASMFVLGACFVLAAVGPAPPKAPPSERFAYPGLIALGVLLYVASAAMPMLDQWLACAVCAMAGTSVILFCIWLARSPVSRETRTEDGREDGSGGGGGPKVPNRPEPPQRPNPEGPALDWGSFDDARAGWEEPSRERELVGV